LKNIDFVKMPKNTQVSLIQTTNLIFAVTPHLMDLKVVDPDYDTEWPLQHGEYRCFPAPPDRQSYGQL
jgi:hypothetical protein